MARRKSEGLTDAEQSIMEVLWSQGGGTVSEVLSDLQARGATPAFNTVQTILRILDRKGYVRHVEEGRVFRYFALVDKAEASRNAVRSVVRRFFDSPGTLALNLLEQEPLSAEEMRRLRQLVARAKKP